MRDAFKILAHNVRGRNLLETREIHPEFFENINLGNQLEDMGINGIEIGDMQRM
jgi:hypothetical protein